MFKPISAALGLALLGLSVTAMRVEAGRPQSVTASLICFQNGSERNVEVAVSWSGIRVKEVRGTAFDGLTPVGGVDASSATVLQKPRNEGSVSTFLNFSYDAAFTTVEWSLVTPKGLVVVDGLLPAADFEGCAP